MVSFLGRLGLASRSELDTARAALAATGDELTILREQLASARNDADRERRRASTAEAASAQALVRVANAEAAVAASAAARASAEASSAAAEAAREDAEQVARVARTALASARDDAARAAVPEQPPAAVDGLIVMSDRLVDLVGPLGPEEATEVITWLAGRVDALLEASDVTALVDAGRLDPSRHEVVHSRPASVPEHVGLIADTVRPGYTWRGRLLRPQQVIAYVAADAGAAQTPGEPR